MRNMRLVFALLLLSGAASAQSDRGTITGTVTDPADAVIPRAAVSAVNVETGSVYRTTTTETGNYTLAQLPAGRYNLAFESQGFNKYVQEGIRVYVARSARIDVAMQVGTTTESVTVSADAPLLKSDNAEQSTTIAREKLDELPLNFGTRGNNASANIRNPYTFVSLVPSGNLDWYNSIKLNGAPVNTFSVRVEGQEANNNRLNIRQDQIQPSVEALEEVSVQTSNFAPEYGQVAGGMFNLTARSGTNQFHGSAFEYFVNEALNAGLPYTDNGGGDLVRPRNRRHNYGFSVGGPVIIPKVYDGHNKTFFFFSLEKFHQGQLVSGRLETVPTDAMRGGDFSAALTGRQLATDPLGRPILENTVYDPNSGQTVDGQVVRDPFANNVIPQSLIDPVAAKIQAFIPTATRAGIINNWDQSYAADTDESIPSIKIDQYFSNQGKLSFFFSQYRGPHYNGSDGLPVPITAVRWIDTFSRTYRLNYDQPITPTILLHLGAGFVRHTNPDTTLPESLEYDPVAGLGLVGAVNGMGFPRINGLNSGTGGGMSMVMGMSGGSIFMNKPTAVVNVSVVSGNHTYKFGGDWRIDSLGSRNISGTAGNYNFDDTQSGLPSTQGQNLSGGNVGLPYASFLLGMANSASINNATDPQSRKPSLALFWQDNWKVTRKLTVDYGVRWDHQGYPAEIHGRTSFFSPDVVNPSAGGLLGGTAYEGDGPGRCNCRAANTYNYAFGPRLGVAYQLTPKTVLRAGWGITYAQTASGKSDIQTTLGAGGWNTINFQTPAFGEPSVILRDGLSYSLDDLYRETLDPGVRPSPGQIDSPPAFIDPSGGRPPRLNQWNISLQRELSRNLVIEAAYVGNRGAWFAADGLIDRRFSVGDLIDLNGLTTQRLSSFGLDITNADDRSVLASRLDSPQAQEAGFTAPYEGFPLSATVAQSLRPYPQFGNIDVRGAPLGNTWYDSLQTKLTKRYSNGLDLLGTFTWQKELTTIGPVNNVVNRANQKQVSALSEPLIFMVAAHYRVPKFGPNRFVRNLVGGWTIGTILRYASGMPIRSPQANNALNTVLPQASNPTTFANRVEGAPLFLKDLNCHCIDPNKDFVLNPDAWSDPAAGQFGTAAAYYSDYRYARRPDEQINIGREFRIKEGIVFSVRAEFFNVFNRTFMNNPDVANAQTTQKTNSQGIPISGFGRINSGSVFSDPRNGQLVARITF